MEQPNFAKLLDEALAKAFASQEPRTRLAYMQLADFYEHQAQREAVKTGRGSAQIFR